MVDVIFVGAGPVGLYAAIQMKLYNPDSDILMYEKYQEYQRKHILIIEKSSYKNSHPNPEFQSILKDLVGKVPTSEIEQVFLNYAQKIGINIRYEEVQSCDDLVERHPEVKAIVGSEGSHSLVRKQIFDDRKIIEKDLQYIAELKYQVHGEARALTKLTEYPAVLSMSNHLISEFVGRCQNNESPVSIRFFIEKSTFEAVKELGVTFKKPWHLDDIHAHKANPVLKPLLQDIQRWKTAREEIVNEVMVEGSDKITIVNLPVYRSEKFTQNMAGRDYFLVGDAALGVPYFRALNAGLIGASHLAKSVTALLKPEQALEPAHFLSSYSKISSASSMAPLAPAERYQEQMDTLADKEINRAQWKNTGLAIAQSSAASSQSFPVSRYKLEAGVRVRLQDDDEPEISRRSKGCAIM